MISFSIHCRANISLIQYPILPPKLKISPSDIVVESSDPNTTFIQVYNANNDTLITWSSSSNENWLELSAITGTTPDLIYLNVDTSLLSEGFYSAIVTIWNSANPAEPLIAWPLYVLLNMFEISGKM